ncbi:MAG: DUF6353 family protein [Candidatus Izemoplasmataceae bacterium]
MNKFSIIANRVGFWTKAKTPELLVAGAIIAAAGSIILAIKATPKAEIILEKSNNEIKRIKADMIDEHKIANKEYSISDGKKELTKVYGKTTIELGKLYLPTAIGFSLTVSSILGSHKVMKGRNMALAAAYTTLENGYRAYRGRVAAKVGESVEKDIFRNVYSEKREVIETDKNGKEVVKVKNVNVPHVDVDSDFTVIYDKNSLGFTRDANLNLNKLAMNQKYLNQRLQTNGALFLYEVYNDIGIDISTLGEDKVKASRTLGWIYDPSDDTRDSYVSFGLFDQNGNRNEYATSVLRNNDQEIFLEFNVDGDIFNGYNGNKSFTRYRKVL